jgi:hypothetical protein
MKVDVKVRYGVYKETGLYDFSHKKLLWWLIA